MPVPPTQIDESVELMDEENIDKELRTIRERSQIDENSKILAEVRSGNEVR
jgi:hypothetical protein